MENSVLRMLITEFSSIRVWESWKGERGSLSGSSQGNSGTKVVFASSHIHRVGCDRYRNVAQPLRFMTSRSIQSRGGGPWKGRSGVTGVSHRAAPCGWESAEPAGEGRQARACRPRECLHTHSIASLQLDVCLTEVLTHYPVSPLGTVYLSTCPSAHASPF